MIYLAIIVGCILGAILGMNAPIISYTYSTYLAIAVIAALDSVFGGISSVLKKTFDLKIFLSGFFVNSILSILLTVLGQKLNVDIYLATIFVFVSRMFNNLTIIRRYYVEKWSEKLEKIKQIKWKNIVKNGKKGPNITTKSITRNVTKTLQKYYRKITKILQILLTIFLKCNIYITSKTY